MENIRKGGQADGQMGPLTFPPTKAHLRLLKGQLLFLQLFRQHLYLSEGKL